MPGARNWEQCDTGFLSLTSSLSSVGKPNKNAYPRSHEPSPLDRGHLFHMVTTFPLMKFKSAHGILMFNCPQLGPLGLDGILMFLNHPHSKKYILYRKPVCTYIDTFITETNFTRVYTLTIYHAVWCFLFWAISFFYESWSQSHEFHNLLHCDLQCGKQPQESSRLPAMSYKAPHHLPVCSSPHFYLMTPHTPRKFLYLDISPLFPHTIWRTLTHPLKPSFKVFPLPLSP